MTERWLVALLVLATARWWWVAFRALVSDLWVAGEPFESRESAPVPRRRGPFAVLVPGRTPLNRVLAFRGVARRVAARERWEAGFGRRGL